MKTPSTHSILISPINFADRALLDRMMKEMHKVFGFSVRVASVLDDVEFAYDRRRRQYHSTPILEALDRAAPPNFVKVLGITKEDLFIPILTHVFGEAQLGGRASIISTNRLGEDFPSGFHVEKFRCRVVKEAIHELGHTFNLRHCKDPTCLMHYCRTVRDVDRKSEHLCRYCQVLLSDEISILPGE
ncbi:MAG: archaemetzincin family Zn-dependent metalloprotease [Deltaproteobacteria bacterium]|nr:archaemetzincin family Zn-dependent metalloprotease [Deltaproteobacteria bacterium]MBW1950007.1 archaemetzincin family Zn-dependent metalloprotease [Deltaproteobacteria bacterium]MBW2008296.1 archaemetzincin family Zn-dependent metalloprotease [Deltaproteobacteria bacterium]